MQGGILVGLHVTDKMRLEARANQQGGASLDYCYDCRWIKILGVIRLASLHATACQSQMMSNRTYGLNLK